MDGIAGDFLCGSTRGEVPIAEGAQRLPERFRLGIITGEKERPFEGKWRLKSVRHVVNFGVRAGVWPFLKLHLKIGELPACYLRRIVRQCARVRRRLKP